MLLTSADKRKDETVSQLVSLWQTVFGDSEDYIRLFEPYLDSFDCYVIKEEGRIVSAFYLLPTEIRTEKRIYKGSYLYAAATYKENRCNGYMSSLISEAISDKENESDFISLVPADDGLYNYYGRFGFEPIMFNYRTKLICEGVGKPEGNRISDAESINLLRKNKFDNVHIYADNSMNYALSCYSHFGSYFTAVNDSAVMYDEDEKTIYEGIFSENEKVWFIDYLKKNCSGEIFVVTPYRIDDTTEKIRCGMVLDFSGELNKQKEIYMNHTLI